MSQNDSSIFRKSSLDRVSSPEQLNEYIKVTNPGLILILIGIFTILIAGAVWVFTGGIPKTLELKSTVATNLSGEQKLYCYVPIATGRRFSPGMDVQISPDYAERAEYGYVKGKIHSISESVVTQESLISKFQDPQIVVPLVNESMAQGNVVEVEIDMGEWSSEKGKEIKLTEGTCCVASVVIGETKLYKLIFEK